VAVVRSFSTTPTATCDRQRRVVVSRKYYRNGDSEYRICDKICRLRDVNELFMDTGLGRDGYSLIGQGKIAEIIGAKSTQRREIFEEAAGISKYRYRKEDAERSLVQADENLLRLRDNLSALEERVGPLREQSDKAKKFLELAEEKKIARDLRLDAQPAQAQIPASGAKQLHQRLSGGVRFPRRRLQQG
jgi:chromosome segregation protein